MPTTPATPTTSAPPAIPPHLPNDHTNRIDNTYNIDNTDNPYQTDKIDNLATSTTRPDQRSRGLIETLVELRCGEAEVLWSFVTKRGMRSN